MMFIFPCANASFVIFMSVGKKFSITETYKNCKIYFKVFYRVIFGLFYL